MLLRMAELSSNCSDRGVWLRDSLSCNCTNGWRGDRCENIICFNNGTANAEGRWCKCPLVFTGQHCEKIACDLGSRPFDNFTGCQCPDAVHYSGDLCDVLTCEHGGAAVGPECVCSVWYSLPYCSDRSAGYYACIAMAILVCVLFVAMILKNILVAILKRRRSKDEQSNNNGSATSLAVPSNVDQQLLADRSLYSSAADNGSVRFARNGREQNSIISETPDVSLAERSRKLRQY